MGAWGTGILSDDTARDVYDSYIDSFNRGNPRQTIQAKILEEFAEILDDEDEGPLVWLGMAKAQWDCGQLETEVMANVRRIVRDGIGLARWAEQGDRLLQRRKAALNQFLANLEKNNLRPLRPRKAIKRNPVFQPGDCLAVKLQDGTWGAILVLQHTKESDDPYEQAFGINLVAGLRYRDSKPPELNTFEKRDWLFLTHHSWSRKMLLCCAMPIRFRSVKDRFIRVGNIPLNSTDPRHTRYIMHTIWANLPRDIYLQYRWELGFRDD